MESSKNQISVNEIFSLLEEIITNPEKFSDDELLLKALFSQNALAKYCSKEHSITPVSLNTLKSISNKTIPGGFANLDFRRKKARELLLKSPKKINEDSRNKKSLELRISLLEAQVRLYEEDLYHISRALWRAISDARSYVKRSGNEMLIEECAQNEEVIRGMASLMSRKILESVK